MSEAAFRSQMVEQVRLIAIWQWVGLLVFIAFLVGMGMLAMGAMRQFQSLRSRRIKPLMDQGKALAINGTAVAKSGITHGKAIYETLMTTAEAVGMKSQTTARIVRGTIPQATQIPGDFAAATQDARLALRTAKTVEAAVKTARGVNSIVKMLGTFQQALRGASQIRAAATATTGSTTGATGMQATGAAAVSDGVPPDLAATDVATADVRPEGNRETAAASV